MTYKNLRLFFDEFVNKEKLDKMSNFIFNYNEYAQIHKSFI